MLPDNILSAIKALALPQKPLPTTTTEAVAKTAQFELGQKLQGIVQDQIAPNVFKVNVAGQLIQMQLPAIIRSGDVVGLQVISLQPRLTFGMVNSANPLSTPEQLGSTARLLSALSQQPPEKAYVRAMQTAPLWEKAQPPESKQLAGLLHEALGNSGLFYESHQAQWLGGARSTAQLLQEPQNQTPEQVKAALAGNPANKAVIIGETANANKPTPLGDYAGKTPVANDNVGKPVVAYDVTGKAVMTSANAQTMANPDANLDAASTTGNTANANAPNQPNSPSSPESKASGIPEHLQPLVQQQLNALETRQILWQGNVWPDQPMQWEIHEQASQQTPGEQEQRQWVTQLQLNLPNLGDVGATLRFNSAGLSLTLNAGSAETRAVLGNASTRLVAALSEAGIPVLSTQVTQENPG